MGGEKGVSISDVEDERFIARFSCEEDMHRVFDREPWDFDRSLIVMGRFKDVESVTDVVLSTAVFWIQAYGVPFRFRTPEVARDIGGLFGEFVDVKSDNEGSCVGRFIRIRVRMDVSIALLRQTMVDFPGSGEQLVAFKYERLPEFCQECGIMGHPTRVYDEKLGIKGKLDSERPFLLSLRADMDLQGRRLGPRVSRGRTDVSVSGDGSDGGSGSGSWSRREDMGVKEKVGDLLQLEGPTQDIASSPVKKVEPKSKSKGVIIAERFVAQQRILQLKKVMKETKKLVKMDEDVKVASVVSNPVINDDVLGTAAMLDRSLQLGDLGGEIKPEEVRTLSAVLKTAFESSNQVV